MSSRYQTCQLTASQKARLDGEVVFHWPHWCLCAAKWIFTIVLGLLVLCGAVVSRMSLIAVPYSKSDPFNVTKEFKFLTLVLIVMVPYAVEFLRCLWLHGFVRGHLWPSRIAIGLGIVVSLVEVFGVCYFTIAVLTLPDLSSTERILFTNAIFVLPAIKKFFNARTRESYLNLLGLTTLLVDLGGLVWGIYKFSTLKTRIALPASIALITVAWFSPLRQWQTKLPTGARLGNPNPLSINNGSRSLSGSYRLTEFRDLLSPSSFCGRATLKSGILNSALKLFAVPFVSAFFCHFYNVADLHDVSAHDIGPSMGFYWNYLWVNILSSFGVYLLGCLACSMGLQRVAFATPLLIVTPVCLFFSSVLWSCKSTIIRSTCGFVTGSEHYHVLVIAALFWVGMLCYVLLYIWKPQRERMAKEKDLFLIPYSYSGVFLEQYLILNREDKFVHYPDIAMYSSYEAKVFLCTTMYREDPKLMEQYLGCLLAVYNSARKYRSIETHVVFDDAFAAKRTLNEHARVFIALCKDMLKESDANVARTIDMPYGSQIVITLEDGMLVYLHFKDTEKVKKGKRWSQLMIMSWIIDTKRDSVNEPSNSYFLTCDADVAFSNSSIEKLLDLMVRKPYVGGATCRIHAEGSGPVVWYQMFEYAIWHWIVKAANSVIGSVLCCTGCFSIFRLQSLIDVLPVFSRPTENGADYIRKDLGEDRWLSCLLLKTGWVLDYCSLAEVSTACPETFDDFFQQRRHWIISSFANTCSLIKNLRKVRQFNNRLSLFFFAYLIATVFFMLISPSVMIWIIAGVLYYDTGKSDVLLGLGIPLMGLFLLYIASCLYTKPDFHRAFAKGGSYILSIVVFVLAVVSIVNMIIDPKKTLGTDDPTYHLDKKIGLSVSLLYLIIYGGVFVATVLLHPTEIYCCLQSLWYLLCLPAFNIFLVTYSVCNLNKSNLELDIGEDDVGWYLRFLKFFGRGKKTSSMSACCSCCSSLQESIISEAIDVHEPEKFDKCQGIEGADIPPEKDYESPAEELSTEDADVVDVSIVEQRRYWEQLQVAFLAPCDELRLEDRQKQLCHIRNGALLVFSIVNILWFIVDYGVVLYNPLGFASLTLFTAIVIIQFVAMLYHRLMTVATELSEATFIPSSYGETRPRESASLLEN